MEKSEHEHSSLANEVNLASYTHIVEKKMSAQFYKLEKQFNIVTRRCVIEEEIEELNEKPLCRLPSGNRSTRQLVGIHGLVRDPPSLIYLLYLSPPSSYSNRVSWNRVLSSSPDLAICLIASAKAWFLPILPSSTKSLLDTLKRCDKCLGY